MKFTNVLKAAALMTLVNASPVVESALSGESPVTVTEVPLSEARLAELELDAAANGTLVARADGCYWTAYSGDFCNGPVGGAISIGDRQTGCIGTQDRHSFFVSAACPTLNVIYFEKHNCGGRLTSTLNKAGCFNVHTGFNWWSSIISRA